MPSAEHLNFIVDNTSFARVAVARFTEDMNMSRVDNKVQDSTTYMMVADCQDTTEGIPEGCTADLVGDKVEINISAGDMGTADFTIKVGGFDFDGVMGTEIVKQAEILFGSESKTLFGLELLNWDMSTTEMFINRRNFAGKRLTAAGGEGK